MTKVNKIVSVKDDDKKRTAASKDIKIIDMYSAKNTITNKTDLYSVLNPLTSSLSPSAKSKGDRLASARTETEKMRKTIENHVKTGMCFDCLRSYMI